MMPAARQARILGELRRQRVVSTEELAELCATSGDTIRRDLAILGGQGKLQRVHGGAARGSGAGCPKCAPTTVRRFRYAIPTTG